MFNQSETEDPTTNIYFKGDNHVIGVHFKEDIFNEEKQQFLLKNHMSSLTIFYVSKAKASKFTNGISHVNYIGPDKTYQYIGIYGPCSIEVINGVLRVYKSFRTERLMTKPENLVAEVALNEKKVSSSLFSGNPGKDKSFELPYDSSFSNSQEKSRLKIIAHNCQTEKLEKAT